jgi:ABC-type antimicrobial peptide transport system permease subunit
VVRRVVADRDPRLALFAVRTSSDLVRNAVSTRRLLLWLVAGFAIIGSLLAILGLYGTVSYVVAGRTREMGVRIAVGATAADIHRLVLGYGARYAGTGVLVGAIGAIAMRGVLQSQLFGVDATNWWILAFAASVLVVASLMACVAPARRAVGFDALQSLRAD